MASVISTYKTELKNLIKNISFGSPTQILEDFIVTYRKSVRDKPNTLVRIHAVGTGNSIRSEQFESRSTQRVRTIFLDIRTYAENREEQAEEDLAFLQEEILKVLKDALKNTGWCDGILDTDNLQFDNLPFEDNYYTSTLPIEIQQWDTNTV